MLHLAATFCPCFPQFLHLGKYSIIMTQVPFLFTLRVRVWSIKETEIIYPPEKTPQKRSYKAFQPKVKEVYKSKTPIDIFDINQV